MTDRRNRIVHSGHAWHVSGEQITMLWTRNNAKRSTFQALVESATAEDVHAVARELERLGLEGVDLMGPVQKYVAGEEWSHTTPNRWRIQ